MESIAKLIFSAVAVIWVFLFVISFKELDNAAKRHHLWEHISKLIEEYQTRKSPKTRKKIAASWKKFKFLWENFRYNKVSRIAVKDREEFLISAGIIGGDWDGQKNKV